MNSTFTIRMASPDPSRGIDLGTVEANDAPSAALLAMQSSDPTVPFESVTCLSTSQSYGRPAQRTGGNGNGAQCTDDWLYVFEGSRFCGIYRVGRLDR